ncbi:hypothetical protein [Candidatus Poriferisodalis sp.]|uniref:hypothetical protein n=1 Tax=Candidatus Poriferisodalis sp. TaxID=3101277 RepID=UPI003B01D2D9
MSKLGALAGAVSDYTADYTYLKGMYAIGPERLPYYALTMSVSDASRNLVLARDVVFDVKRPVKLEELFQRDLDIDRARTEIQTYLKRPESLKFFNSLTVVLLPVEAGDAPIPMDHYPASSLGAPIASADEGLTTKNVGPIQIREMEGGAVGLIRWNTRQIRPVVIDGQHRLFALRELLADAAFVKYLGPDSTQIPILALVLDSRVGYEPPQGGPTGVLSACRTIFVDINKNAKRVEGARLALLNDRSIADCSMRLLLTDGIGIESEISGERPGQVPLALVDWHSELAKFDQSLYLSSVPVLRDVVNKALDLKQPDPYALDEWRAYLNRIEARLEPEPADGWERSSMESRLRHARRDELPFGLTQAETRAAANGYVRGPGSLVVEPLLKAEPYAQLVSAYRAAGLIDGQFELWLGHDDVGKRVFERYSNSEVPDAELIAREIKDRYSLAYQVVFQKGILASVQLLESDREEALKALTGESHPGELATRSTLTAAWLARFDMRIATWFNEYDFWRGFGVRLDGNIDFTQTAPSAIAGFIGLALVAPFDDWLHSSRPEEGESAQQSLFSLVEGRPIGEGLTVPRYGGAIEDDVALAAEWLFTQLGYVRGGSMGESYGHLVRSLASPWLRSVRQYFRQVARTDGLDVSDDEARLLTAVHGGWRLAMIRNEIL